MTQGLAESYKFEHVPLALFFFFFFVFGQLQFLVMYFGFRYIMKL